jgi:hypothetical protein
LAEKNREVLTSQGREGNVTDLKRKLREAQDMIMQLHESQRVSKERDMKTPQGAWSSLRENLRTEET